MVDIITISLNSGGAHPSFVTYQRLEKWVSAIDENPDIRAFMSYFCVWCSATNSALE